MASRRINVLVYSGPGTAQVSLTHTLATLRSLLDPNYAVTTISEATLLTEPWQSTTALFVMPGGADLPFCRILNGHGNRLVRAYVHAGGAYLGLCAGAYYAADRCEFEVGRKGMEVVGERELSFYPGVCRGSAFRGFMYGSEAGTRAAELKVEGTSFAGIENASLPERFQCYFNGGGCFVDARILGERGVEVLARFAEALDVDGGDRPAAVVYRRIGEGRTVLTGPHPEYSADNMTYQSRNMDAATFSALEKSEKQRADFFKACLMKLGLGISNDQDAGAPSLSPIHLSSSDPSGVSSILSALQKEYELIDGEHDLQCEQDTFCLQRSQSAWTMTSLTRAAFSSLSGTSDSDQEKAVAKQKDAQEQPPTDASKLVKSIILHDNDFPSVKDTPHFNHQAYYAALEEYILSKRLSDSTSQTLFGQNLLYGEVVTSTSTLLEKNPSLTRSLPPGTTFTATTQISGRGRGSNVWISPRGSLMFSFILTHPLALSATAPVVFLQYLAAIAVAEAVQNYDRARYKDVPVRLKWPNDIYAGVKRGDGREESVKIGGILVNTQYSGGDYDVVVGIGLNVSNAAPTTSLNNLVHDLNAAADKSGSSQSSLQGFTPERLLASVLTTFSALYAMFKHSGFPGAIEQLYYKHWLHEGQIVTLEEEGGVKARIRGVTRDWGLLLAEEVRGETSSGTGRAFALQSDSNSFDFMKGLVKRKI